MTEATEPAATPAGVWTRIAPFVAPPLVFLAVVVPFLKFHDYNMLLPESLMLLGGAAAIGLAVGALGRLRSDTLAPLLTAFVIAAYVFCRQDIGDWIVALSRILGDVVGSQLAALVALAVLTFAILAVCCLVTRRHIDTIVSAVFGTIVASTVLLPTASGGAPVETGELPAALKPLPPVVHVILDEHIGYAGFPAGFDMTEVDRGLISGVYRDFAIYSHAYSRFAETKFSLTSLMNGDIGADVPDFIDGEDIRFAPKQNDWLARLKRDGYAIKVYQSAWYDMCSGPVTVDACYTYGFFTPNPVQRAPLSTTQRLRVLLTKLFGGRKSLEVEPMVTMEALDRFRSDIRQSPRGVAYIVHALIPHSGYFYSADCTLVDPSAWARDSYGDDLRYTDETRDRLYRRYLDQVACAARQMDSIFAELKELGVYDEATIIVHGDHGSRIGNAPYITDKPLTDADMIDHYSTFVAIKAPGQAPGIHEEPIALQRIFADTFLGGEATDRLAADAVFMRTDEGDDFTPLVFAWPAKETPLAALFATGGKDGAVPPLLDDLRR